jgi:hypothetical protein
LLGIILVGGLMLLGLVTYSRSFTLAELARDRASALEHFVAPFPAASIAILCVASSASSAPAS